MAPKNFGSLGTSLMSHALLEYIYILYMDREQGPSILKQYDREYLKI